MTHEMKAILAAFLINKKNGLKSVLATVVKVEGSSYRRPGVRMLIAENGAMTGAVSGGCVEKEISGRAREVFDNNTPVLMAYDGRYRLGCEGIVYILIEPFHPGGEFIEHFGQLIRSRRPIPVSAYYPEEVGSCSNAGSYLHKNEQGLIGFREGANIPECGLLEFRQILKPALKLVIFGAEHDAVQLTKFAAQAGWEVSVVASIKDPKTTNDFPGAEKVMNTAPALFDGSIIDEQTSIVLMSHSYSTDLNYLMRLTRTSPIYIGLLGPVRRREKLLDALMEADGVVTDEFLNKIHGPAGLDIGAETPQEIALSIMSEILSVSRKKDTAPLRFKAGLIHESVE